MVYHAGTGQAGAFRMLSECGVRSAECGMRSADLWGPTMLLVRLVVIRSSRPQSITTKRTKGHEALVSLLHQPPPRLPVKSTGIHPSWPGGELFVECGVLSEPGAVATACYCEATQAGWPRDRSRVSRRLHSPTRYSSYRGPGQFWHRPRASVAVGPQPPCSRF